MGVFFERGFERIFGTWPMKGSECQKAVETAFEVGYRAVDTAQMYGNEDAVGAALAASGLPADDVLITTKVHPDNFGENRFIASVETSLKALGMEAVDVLLLHWPPVGEDVGPSLSLLNATLKRGLARYVGVSNYTTDMMRQAVATIDGPVVINQVEFHPLLDQSALLAGSAENSVPLSAYCSVAKGRVFDSPELISIGEAHGKSAAQVALRWSLQKGVAVVTKSATPKNIAANFDIVDFTLSDTEVARIDRLGAENFRIVDRNRAPWAPHWD